MPASAQDTQHVAQMTREAVSVPAEQRASRGVSCELGLPEPETFEALAYFLEHKNRPPSVTWHDDGA